MKTRFLSASLLVLVCGLASGAPDEEALGKSQGYPVGTQQNYAVDDTFRVGSQSNMDKIFPTRSLPRASKPAVFGKGQLDPQMRNMIESYLERQRVTGLLVIKDDRILYEAYQYNRLPTHRFISHSMAKSITSLAAGFALEDGKIESLDDKVSRYVKELDGYAYGDTTVRNILRMSSGVKFNENYSGTDDFSRFLMLRWEKGLVPALQAFNEREAPQGTRFRYATIETYLLGLVISNATGKKLSDYVAEKLWTPMGAEADAAWVVDPMGVEYAGSSFNAVLRDYGRLGMLLANDGKRNGTQIIPKAYLIEATDWHRHPEAFHPLRATPLFGYGYQFWLMPGEKRRFGLRGIRGQFIYVDPESKLVLVQTAVAKNASVFTSESMGMDFTQLWMALLATYGKP